MHGETAGHAEVHEQHMPPRQVRQQVLAPPLQPLDLAPAQPAGEIVRQRKPQVRPVLIDAREHVPGERRLEAAAHDLDFRQLGHMGGFFAWIGVEDASIAPAAPA